MSRASLVFSLASALVFLGILGSQAEAQSQFTWDATPASSGPQDGGGTWSTSASGTNWWDGTTNVAWSSGNIATFGAGGTAGTVTVSGSVNVAGLAFGNIATGSSGPRYSLTSGTIGFTDNGTISLSGSSGLFNAGVSIGSRLIANNLSVTSSGPFIPNGPNPQAVSLVLSGSNTITGTLSLNGPMLFGGQAAVTQNSVGTAVIEISNGANFSGGTSNFTNDFRIAGNGSGRGAIRIQTSATGLQPGAIYSGSITLTGSAQMWGNSTHNATFLQGFGETAGGSKSLEFANSGVLFLRGISTYTGTTSVNAGSVVLDAGNNTLSSQTVLSMATTGSKLVLGGTVNGAMSQAVSGLISSATGVSIVAGTSSLSTLAVTVATGANTFAGMLGGTAANDNKLTLTKSGAGTLTLTGSLNTYAGNTTISGGTLALGANATMVNSPVIRVGDAGSSGAVLDLTARSGTFTFGSNQTVAGIGTINFGTGKTVAAQGIWAPGNSIGANAVTGNLSLSGTSQFELGTPGTSAVSPGVSDFTAVSGTLTLGGSLVLLDNSGSNSQGSYGAGAYRLFTAPTVSGSFASVTAPAGATTTRVGMNYISGTGSGQGVFANVYNLASATSAQTINVGSTRVGSAATVVVSLANTAPGNATFTETLSTGNFSATTSGFTASGSASGIAGGGSGTGTLIVGLGSGLAAGVQTGTTTLALFTNAVNGSGLAQQAIAAQTVTITGTVWNPAAANVLSGSVGLGSVIKGASFGSFSQALSITNTAPGGFSEKLDASFGTLTGVTTNSGSISLLDPGATSGSALIVGFDTSTVGAKSGAAEVRFSTNGAGTSGLGIAALSPQTVNFTGTVLDHSSPGFVGVPDPLAETTLALDFGSVNDSAGLQTRTFSLTNLFDALVGANLTAGLALTGTATGTGPFSLSGAGFSNLVAGGTSSLFTVSFTPSSQGTFTQQFTLSFADTQSLAGAATRRDLTVGATVIVVPEPRAHVLASFGIVVASWMAWRRRRLPT